MHTSKKRLIKSLSLILLISGLLIILNLSRDRNSVSIDFSKSIGTISLDYGLNEAASWMDFAEIRQTHQLHQDVGSRFIRVWVDDPDYRMNSTIPYQSGIYNFYKLDSFINAVLASNATPFVVFAHAPKELSVEYGEQVNARLPKNNQEFAVYCSTIVDHYKKMCDEDKLVKKCNIDEWYWEIWNEPYWEYFWEKDEYIDIYNQAYKAIKEVAPNTNVGGYTLKFLTQEDKERAERFLQDAAALDFISLHIYGNYPISEPKDETYIKNLKNSFMKNLYEQEMIKNNKKLFFKQINSIKSSIKANDIDDVEIIVSELGPNWNWKYEPYLDEPFVASWYASALSWMIKTNLVAKEFYYSGTSDLEDGGFAMWSIDNNSNSIRPFPVYYMKKGFVKYNAKGSSIYEAESKNRHIELLAVSNKNGKYLTIINKKNKVVRDVKINIKNLEYSQIIDLNYGKNLVKPSIDLNAYEVKFLEII